MVPDRFVRGEKKCALCSKMVLTTASTPPSTLQGMFGSPPKRGATLPKYLSGSNAGGLDSAGGGGGAKRTARANTLPGHVATMNINNRDASETTVISTPFCLSFNETSWETLEGKDWNIHTNSHNLGPTLPPF